MNAYTPYEISQNPGMIFQIPLYQRLFEWDDEQIEQLMSDLHSSFMNTPSRPYYIGMLTSKVSDVIELVDGQQRFTVMMLLGIYFEWTDFLKPIDENGERHLRLQFYAREVDKEYLNNRIDGNIDPAFQNSKMENGISCISRYVENKSLDKGAFGDYIFKHLTFFLSKLPQDYTSRDLNTYFERMNTTGKALENHEIIKVELLRRIVTSENDTDKKESYTKLWNAVSQMDRTLLMLKASKNKTEPIEDFRRRYKIAILNVLDGKIFEDTFHGMGSGEIDEITSSRLKRIIDIPESNEAPPSGQRRRSGEHAMLTFPEFLLQVLFLTRGYTGDEIVVTDFFDDKKLKATFDAEIEKGLDIEQFLNNLLLYRLLTDYFLVRMDDEGEEPYPFDYYGDIEGKGVKQCVRQYQSMLYSASTSQTYYKWMPKILSFLKLYVDENKTLDLPASSFLTKLKAIDDSWHPREDLVPSRLYYPVIDRYWFWRMDYYLWENRKQYFRDENDQLVVNDYVFRRNRSLEHVAPQNPEGMSKFQWDDKNNPDDENLRDSLGNLVMISSGQNSSLSNQPYEKKRTHMELYRKGKLNGNVESLKMYYIYSHHDDWDRNSIKEHEIFSLDFLKGTY